MKEANPFTERLTRNLPGPREKTVQRWIWLVSGTLTALALAYLTVDPWMLQVPILYNVVRVLVTLGQLTLLAIPTFAGMVMAKRVFLDTQQDTFNQVLLTNLTSEKIVDGYVSSSRRMMRLANVGIIALILPLLVQSVHVALGYRGRGCHIPSFIEVGSQEFLACLERSLPLFIGVRGLGIGWIVAALAAYVLMVLPVAVEAGVSAGILARTEAEFPWRRLQVLAMLWLPLPCAFYIGINGLIVSFPVMLLNSAIYLVESARFRKRAIAAIDARRGV